VILNPNQLSQKPNVRIKATACREASSFP